MRDWQNSHTLTKKLMQSVTGVKAGQLQKPELLQWWSKWDDHRVYNEGRTGPEASSLHSPCFQRVKSRICVTRANALSGWLSANGKIQMLVPHDFITSGSDDSKHGQGVFDVRLSHILADLTAKESDNITVILDCCHSGSGMRRANDDPTFAIHGIDLPETHTVAQNLLHDIEPDAQCASMGKKLLRIEG
ncbi:hypothetical protein ARMGADRAFT_1130295 [Armillaria gallica]|uniref:Uncharacterized protein n=1 Tax=Armillaria gallica TaxID=47427 RepID=A0A2H3EFW2_ARMGA|nr:hypothetical protein ARMGADRAFT_1130295 [Armillaria gallica]